MAYITARNPFTRRTLMRIKADSKVVIQQKISLLKNGFNRWAKSSLQERLDALTTIPRLILRDKDKIARDITKEIGTPLEQSRISVELSAKNVEFMLANANEFLKPDKTVVDEKTTNYVCFVPRGVTAVISPWNYPISLPLWCIVPALICGNTVLFKCSENSILSGLNLKRVMLEAGISPGIFQVSFGGPDVGRDITSSKQIDTIAFTGKYDVAMKIIRNSSNSLKKYIFELGGSDVMIILPDASIIDSVNSAVFGITKNSGQACNSIRKIFVENSIAREFVYLLSERLEKLKAGDPMLKIVSVGPLKDSSQICGLKALIKRHRIISGGNFKGNIMEPTLLEMNLNHIKRFDQEFMAPISAIAEFDDLDKIIPIINNFKTGLTCSIWTKDKKAGENLAKSINYFTVSVNNLGRTLDQCPWGGRKRSGIGCILSKYGFHNLCDIQNIRTTN